MYAYLSGGHREGLDTLPQLPLILELAHVVDGLVVAVDVDRGYHRRAADVGDAQDAGVDRVTASKLDNLTRLGELGLRLPRITKGGKEGEGIRYQGR